MLPLVLSCVMSCKVVSIYSQTVSRSVGISVRVSKKRTNSTIRLCVSKGHDKVVCLEGSR